MQVAFFFTYNSHAKIAILQFNTTLTMITKSHSSSHWLLQNPIRQLLFLFFSWRLLMLFTPTKYRAHTKILAHHFTLACASIFCTPRRMLILSILEEQVRSGGGRKGNNAAVHSLVRWQRQLSSAALTQITHEKAQMLNRNYSFFIFSVYSLIE